jgi:hypothetical protein
MKTENGDAYRAVRMIYDNSPGRSWQRLNGALSGTLSAAITAHLSFLPGDFAAMRRDMMGHFWMGNSEGSICGERFYRHMVDVGHTPACISFEQYAERPPALWSEEVKTPERLCIGKKFTWDGLLVNVTNMTEKHLIACHYKDGSYDHDKLSIGSVRYFHEGYRKIVEVEEGKQSLRVKFSGVVPEPDRTPSRRFKIPYEELAAKRKEHDAAKKAAFAEFAAADSEKGVAAIAKKVSEQKHLYRPFDIEELSKAFSARVKALRGDKD